MTGKCKFCGNDVHIEHYLHKNEYSCGKCSEYCMKYCEIASKCDTSWHKEPCTSCEHNPYRLNHTWNGKEWNKND